MLLCMQCVNAGVTMLCGIIIDMTHLEQRAVLSSVAMCDIILMQSCTS